MPKPTWDDFGEEVANDSAQGRQGPKCKTCVLLSNLKGKGLAKLEDVLAAPQNEITSASIRRALLSRVDARQLPSEYSISRHRRGSCRGSIDG